MPYPTLTFTEWEQRRNALVAEGRVAEALALASTHQIIAADGSALNTPTGAAPAQGGSTPAGERFDRQAAVRERAARLIEQGVSVEQAERNAARAIAYERGEDFEVDIESLSLSELRDHIQTFDPSVLRAGQAETYVFDETGTLSNDELTATMQSMREAHEAEQAETAAWSEGLYDRMQARAASNEARAAAEQVRAEAIRSISAANPHLTPETVESLAPSVEALVAASAKPKTASDQAREELATFDPSVLFSARNGEQ